MTRGFRVGPAPRVDLRQRQLRQRGDAVITLLPVNRVVGIAHRVEGLARKQLVHHLGFLQAQHIGLPLFQEAFDQVNPAAHRIDVPGRDPPA